ncbi:MAG: hypothetical protein NC548_41270 [Lachnospiraceae bacterium]|nr:hypothetical protein [Lachnospiraceae bacterium]
MGKTLRIKCLIIALIFIIISVSGVCVAFSFGENLLLSAFMYGSGSKDDPYKIYTSDQMMSLQEVSSSRVARFYTEDKYFKLCNDVTLITTPTASSYGFYGYLDGNGNTLKIKDGALFYKIAQGATVSNLEIELDLKMYNTQYKYGIALKLDKGAIIQNCNIYGNIDIDLSGFYRWPWSDIRCYCAPFCIANNGLISNCSFNGNITCYKPSSIIYRYVSGIAIQGEGIIEQCKFMGNIDLDANANMEIVAGLSTFNNILDSLFEGDIRITKSVDSREYQHAGLRTVIYGLGASVQNSKFIGDIIFDRTYRPHTCYIANEESTYEFQGEIKRILTDGSTEVLL